MNIREISTTWSDYPDNESNAIIVFFSGCSHGCTGCHNKELQNFKNGNSVSPQELMDKLSTISFKEKTDKIIFEGGDCFFERNRADTLEFLDKYGELFEICIYTGYSIDEVKEFGLKKGSFHFIKCGKYNETQKDIHSGKDEKQIIFASKNQRLYNSDFELISQDNCFLFDGE